MLHPLVAVGMLIAIVLILTLPRTKAIVPFLLSFFTIPLAQVAVLGGLHFPVLRILVLAGLIRVVAFPGAEKKRFEGFNALDRVVVLWSLSALVIFMIEWPEMQALIKGVGDLLDSLGGYLVVRYLIPDREAVRRTVKVLAAICVIQGICMMSEQITHQNVFSFLGANEPAFRSGNIRSEGAIGTLYAGALAGVSIPLFLWLWTEVESRMAAWAGIAGATTMVFASHASTSWLGYGAGLLALALWPLRKSMRLVRWGIVATLVGLHLVMNGPVWSLIEKIDLTGGSSSYHRYMLVDNCIRHFGDWWLIGYRYFGDWGQDMWDLCNQFVAAALTGGLVTLILFVGIYKRGFGAIGTARKHVEGDRKQEWFFWCFGSFLFANVVASFGVNYMVQLMTFLSTFVACISVATFEAKQTTRSVDIPTKIQFAFEGPAIAGRSPISQTTQKEW